MISDELSDSLPPLDNDPLQSCFKPEIPHTMASAKVRDIVPVDNMAYLHIKEPEQSYLSTEEMQRLFTSRDSRLGMGGKWRA
jgi:hypothetical protein